MLQADGQTIDLPEQPRSRPAVGDLTGDGVPDILVGAKDGPVRLYAGATTLATLPLLDVQGEPFDLQITENTMVIGVATWCSASIRLRQWLENLELLGQLDGLEMVFVFGDESAAGGATINDPSYLDGLPGTVAFLAPETLQPAGFLTVFDAALGQFTNQTAFAAIDAWLAAHDLAPETAIPDGPACSDDKTDGHDDDHEAAPAARGGRSARVLQQLVAGHADCQKPRPQRRHGRRPRQAGPGARPYGNATDEIVVLDTSSTVP